MSVRDESVSPERGPDFCGEVISVDRTSEERGVLGLRSSIYGSVFGYSPRHFLWDALRVLRLARESKECLKCSIYLSRRDRGKQDRTFKTQ
jgi:hypothetical protein